MKTSTKAFISLVLLSGLSGLSGCSRSGKDLNKSHITGSLSYSEPVTLAPGSVLELRLTDVSVSDGPALEVAKTTVTDARALPYQYSLGYDATKINAQHRYTVDARILNNGALRFATDSAYEVLTQGHGNQRNIAVITTGNGIAAAPGTANGAQTEIFRNELRAGAQVSSYQAGLQNGHIVWLEEDISNGTPTQLHARYDLKGALVMHYVDSTSLEVKFDERGRPTNVSKNQQSLPLSTQADVISRIRNRAELLRSDALAAHEARVHRLATGG